MTRLAVAIALLAIMSVSTRAETTTGLRKFEYVQPETGTGFARLHAGEYTATVETGKTTDEAILTIAKKDTWNVTHKILLNGGRLNELRDIAEVLHCDRLRILVATETLHAAGGAPVFLYERHLLNADTGALLGTVDDDISFEARGLLPAASVVDDLFPDCDI